MLKGLKCKLNSFGAIMWQRAPVTIPSRTKSVCFHVGTLALVRSSDLALGLSRVHFGGGEPLEVFEDGAMWGFDLFFLIFWPCHIACGILVP